MRYLSIALAAFFPAPIAKITVAAPVAISPPAYIPGMLVFPFSSVSMLKLLILVGERVSNGSKKTFLLGYFSNSEFNSQFV